MWTKSEWTLCKTEIALNDHRWHLYSLVSIYFINTLRIVAKGEFSILSIISASKIINHISTEANRDEKKFWLPPVYCSYLLSYGCHIYIFFSTVFSVRIAGIGHWHQIDVERTYDSLECTTRETTILNRTQRKSFDSLNYKGSIPNGSSHIFFRNCSLFNVLFYGFKMGVSILVQCTDSYVRSTSIWCQNK